MEYQSVIRVVFIQQDFGEKLYEHGYLIWDVKDRTFTEHNIELDYGYYVFKSTSLEDLENEICKN